MADSIRVGHPIRLQHLHKYTSRILLITVIVWKYIMNGSYNDAYGLRTHGEGGESAVFSKSANPLNVSQKSANCALFKAKSVDP